MNETVLAAVNHLKNCTSERPEFGVILGSGQHLEGECLLSFSADEIPGMPVAQTSGHSGRLDLLRLRGRVVAVLSGRRHFYEGSTWEDVTFGVHLLAAWGISRYLFTNAAGAISPGLEVGDLMRIAHTYDLLTPAGRDRNLATVLCRPPEPVSKSDTELAGPVAELKTGTYVAVLGPNYETRSEIRAFVHAGAHAVGMSTVPELIVAAKLGIPALGISVITNSWSRPATFHGHEDVLKAAREASGKLQSLLESLISYPKH